MDLSQPPRLGLPCLPYELVAHVVQHLEIEDVFNLALSCQHFQYIIRADRFCKPVVMTKAAYTLEARHAEETGRFARALRRLTKRRGALSHASPYFVGIVAFADSYEYSGGKLCYTVEHHSRRLLRILDVHQSTDWEIVVDISALVRIAVPQAADCQNTKLRVLHQNAGIVACLFSFTLPDAETENWLLILNPQKHQLLNQTRLSSTHRIFVRNDAKYLYVGTHSGEGADGLRKWVLRGFDLENRLWLSQPRLFLSDVVGYDVGSTVCFEIYDGWFYGLANRILNEVNDPDWTSYYYCFRFPLAKPSREKTQVMNKERSWRRQHSEGPIDDRWGFIQLQKDEGTGCLYIVECRREFLSGSSGSQRTYYTTEVAFQTQLGTEQQAMQREVSAPGTLNDPPQSNIPVPSRSPHFVHTGDDSSVPSMLVRSKTYYCTYFRCCNAYLDLHDDDTSLDASGLPSLRLRAGTRKSKTALSQISTLPTCSPVVHRGELHAQDPYEANEISLWPPRQYSAPNSALDDIYSLINPQGRQGSVLATGDERSVVYTTTTSTNESVKTLMLISFDPAIQFQAMIPAGHIPGQRLSADEASGTVTNSGPSVRPRPPLPNTPERGANRSVDGPATNTVPVQPEFEGQAPWAYLDSATHCEIGEKFFLGWGL